LEDSQKIYTNSPLTGAKHVDIQNTVAHSCGLTLVSSHVHVLQFPHTTAFSTDMTRTLSSGSQKRTSVFGPLAIILVAVSLKCRNLMTHFFNAKLVTYLYKIHCKVFYSIVYGL